MQELLDGLVPGHAGDPERADPGARRGRAALRGRDRADAARQRARRAGGLDVPASSPRSTTLEVPETLHALIAARLDGLGDEERRLVQDGAVLGKTFSRKALAALSGLDESDLEPLLAGARAQGSALAAGRPALARARPVRVPAGPRAPGRVRDALAARPEEPPPRGRGPALGLARARRRSRRWSPRTCWRPSRRCRAPTTPRS